MYHSYHTEEVSKYDSKRQNAFAKAKFKLRISPKDEERE